jgi:hypothetical protein
MEKVLRSELSSETSVDNHFTRQYIPEDNSEHHTRRRENLKSHILHLRFARPNMKETVIMTTTQVKTRVEPVPETSDLSDIPEAVGVTQHSKR